MSSLMSLYVQTAPEVFWKQMRERGGTLWLKVGAPAGRRAEFEARLERRLRTLLTRPHSHPRVN